MRFLSIISVLVAMLLSAVSAGGILSLSSLISAPEGNNTSLGPFGILLQTLINARVHSQNASQTPMAANYMWVPMNVTTPVAVGGPNVTMYGDTKSINAQILKMNPNYKLEDFVGGKDNMAVPAGAPKSAILPPKCNNWPQAGSINTLEEGIVDLNSSSFPVNVPIRSCVALSCIDGDSIGLCNDNPEPITQNTRALIPYLETLIDYCLSSTGTVNGQVFDQGDFNLVFNKGSCKPGSVQGSNYPGSDPGAPVMGSGGGEQAPSEGSGGMRV